VRVRKELWRERKEMGERTLDLCELFLMMQHTDATILINLHVPPSMEPMWSASKSFCRFSRFDADEVSVGRVHLGLVEDAVDYLTVVLF
jgi:hypothetical protein